MSQLVTVNDISVNGLTVGRGSVSLDNTVFGVNGLQALTSGTQNTAIGNSAGQSVNSGTQNTYVGNQSGQNATTGSQNTAIGHGSLVGPMTGSNNVGVGVNTGSNLTSGRDNLAVGTFALTFTTTGSSNVAIGNSAMFNTTGASYNTAIGAGALYNLGNIGSTVAATTIVATRAYQIVTVGTTNYTTIGADSNTVGLIFIATGVGTGTGTVQEVSSQNIGIGNNAGGTYTGGHHNVFIGGYRGTAANISGNIILSDGADNIGS